MKKIIPDWESNWGPVAPQPNTINWATATLLITEGKLSIKLRNSWIRVSPCSGFYLSFPWRDPDHFKPMAQVKKSVNRWSWGMLVANKPPIYYTKCTFWPQNLIFGTNGCLYQLENLMKKHLDLCKTSKTNIKCFRIGIKRENKVSSTFWVAIRSGPI